MQGQFLDLQHTRLYFTKVGNGEKNLLMFHGFGQDHHAFNKLEEQLHGQYTVYAFDIFFHGKSQWLEGEEPLEKPFWKELISDFLTQYRIENFSMLGFSMGGKFVLATLEAFPERIEQIFMLAPDGIKINFWYSLATYPSSVRYIFKSMIDHPQRFKAVENIAAKIGLINKTMARFVESQMDTPEKRKRVYHAWVVFRHLKFDMVSIAKIINVNKIKTTVIVGRYDKIITARSMDKLLSKLDDFTLEILETGHNGVIQESIKVLGKFPPQIL
ncbi:MAG: alpha/beta hydrolase [Bacteroidia bacterium]|nr:alpha/beta hydrolase [Bacteroidia bacterium]